MNSQKSVEKSKRLSEKTNRNRKKSARIIVIMFSFVIGITAIALAVVGFASNRNTDNPRPNSSLIFYEADYDYNIMKDREYLELDRQIYFENPLTGMTVSFTEDTLEDLPKDQKNHILHIYSFINHAINGNTEELNALFSKEYVEAGGKVKLDFTMQQLYNIKITYIDTVSEEVDGNTYVSNDYWLEYMIRKNNGTFRNDMESDCIRKEYVRVTDRAGEMGIDVLSPFTTQVKNEQVIDIPKILTLTAVTFAAIAIIVISVSIIVKKKK
jgi:hypothetical protein